MSGAKRYWFIVIGLAIICFCGGIFIAIKYPTYKANAKAEEIVVGDNEEIEDTTLENIEQQIIHYDDEIGTLTIPDILLENDWDTSNVKFHKDFASKNCPNLTDTSLDNLLQMCINSNVTSSTRKNLNDVGLTATDYPVSRIQALPHYQDFINAGWTIGYE